MTALPILCTRRATISTKHLCRFYAAHYSSASFFGNHRNELLNRPFNLSYDYLTPTSSHLLNLSLQDFITAPDPKETTSQAALSLPGAGSAENLLPQGHHIVYFPPQLPSSSLLPDGTDILHFPGPPYVRRLWAGGSLLFNNSTYDPDSTLKLDGRRAVCVEGIRDVSIKGEESANQEKIFVGIERRIGYLDKDELGSGSSEGRIIARIWEEDENKVGSAAVVERRNIVFLRAKSREEADRDAVAAPRTGRSTIPAPDFSISMTPTTSLLFRFSALTFNAHAIHLNPEYSRKVEGYRNLLLHGPLTVVLMLSALRSQMKEGQVIKRFEYRNLALLYVDEELKICVKKSRDRADKWEVWIMGTGGVRAVMGNALLAV